MNRDEKFVTVFNGPIFCGKDTIVDQLVEDMPDIARKMEMKSRLISITCVIHGVSKTWWVMNYTREGKELPRAELGGMSMRNALIHTSEVVIKPNFGQDYFGVASRSELDASDEKWFFYADGGFPKELIPIGAGLNPLLIRIHREGCAYCPTTDSRNYIKDEDLPPNWSAIDITNVNGEYERFHNDVVDALKAHFN